MGSLRTDSPISRRIVLAFLDFLNSVEPAPGVDVEGLEVVRECLEDVFKLVPSSRDNQTQPHLLVDLFSSHNTDGQHETEPDSCHATVPMETRSTISASTTVNINHSEASESLNEEQIGDPHLLGVSHDELFGQFCGALEKIQFFKPTTAGDDDHAQLEKVKHFFDEALMEMEKSGCQITNCNNLGEALKSRGNQSMQSKLYSEAIDLYTCAIALCENNAVYYCNRAAAYTQVQKYAEAIADCNRSIEINPNYSKAYSRLGLVYYAQGKYSAAITNGFLKALQLDPNSDSVRENIRVAEQKLREEWQRTGHNQNAGPSHSRDPNSQSAAGSNRGAPPFMSMPFNASIPPDFANIIMNMAANAYQGGQQVDGGSQSNDVNDSNEPEVRIDGNINLTIREEVPEEIVGAAWRSVMDMFPSQQGPQGDRHT